MPLDSTLHQPFSTAARIPSRRASEGSRGSAHATRGYIPAVNDGAKRVAERLYEGLSEGRLDLELLSEGIEWVTPASLPWTPAEADDGSATVRYRGLEQFGRYLQSLLAAVEGMKAVTTELLELEDGRILVLGKEIGQSKATGEKFTAPFAHLVTVDDGKVTRLEGFVDTAAMQRAFQAAPR